MIKVIKCISNLIRKDNTLVDVCGSKWNFSDGSINYQWGGGEYNNLIEGLYFDGSKSLTINSPSNKMKEIYNTFSIITCFKISTSDIAIITNIKATGPRVINNTIGIRIGKSEIRTNIGSEIPRFDTTLNFNNKILLEIQVNTTDPKYPKNCVVSYYYNGKYIGNTMNDIERGCYGYNADYILNNINFYLPKGSYLYLFKIYNGLYHKNDYSQETPFYNIEYKNIILQ